MSNSKHLLLAVVFGLVASSCLAWPDEKDAIAQNWFSSIFKKA